jgi:D-mannonate dehydratase
MIPETARILAACQGAMLGLGDQLDAECEVVIATHDISVYYTYVEAISKTLGCGFAEAQHDNGLHARIALHPDDNAYWPCVTIHYLERSHDAQPY